MVARMTGTRGQDSLAATQWTNGGMEHAGIVRLVEPLKQNGTL